MCFAKAININNQLKYVVYRICVCGVYDFCVFVECVCVVWCVLCLLCVVCICVV